MTMPRQNRVTPVGEIVAVPERGTIMGNRGNLHDDNGNIQRAWRGNRWIVCALAFRGRKRTVMTPGEYTELFFLDEATALAAGHRPCAECRRARFIAFCNTWKVANLKAGGVTKLTATLIDKQLHAERVNPDSSKCVFAASLQDLPDGVFVNFPALRDQAYLLLAG